MQLRNETPAPDAPPPAKSPGATVPYKESLGAVLHDAEKKYLVRMLKTHKGKNHFQQNEMMSQARCRRTSLRVCSAGAW